MSAFKKIFTFLCVAVSVISIYLLFYAFDIKQVNGNSMHPTFRKGDWIIINTFYNEKSFFSRYKSFFCGDILVFRSPLTDEMLVKRVAGTEGMPLTWLSEDTFRIGSETVTVKPQKKYLFKDFTKVPKHAIFFLGDNPSESSDSRDFGFVSTDRVEGKVLFGRYYEKKSSKRKPAGNNR